MVTELLAKAVPWYTTLKLIEAPCSEVSIPPATRIIAAERIRQDADNRVR